MIFEKYNLEICCFLPNFCQVRFPINHRFKLQPIAKNSRKKSRKFFDDMDILCEIHDESFIICSE